MTENNLASWFDISKIHSEKVLQCFPRANKPQYALYLLSLDRFFLVDSLDLWSMQYAAKLLSSKLILVVCVLPPNVPFDNRDCMNWTINKKEPILPKKQTPSFTIFSEENQFLNAGISADFIDKTEVLKKEQSFALFVLKATQAMILTDLVVGSSDEVNNDNQKFYLDLLPQNADKKIIVADEKTPWGKGFLNEIGKILYVSDSINEALASFSKLQFEKHEQSQENYKKVYLDTFFNFFGWRPSE